MGSPERVQSLIASMVRLAEEGNDPQIFFDTVLRTSALLDLKPFEIDQLALATEVVAMQSAAIRQIPRGTA